MNVASPAIASPPANTAPPAFGGFHVAKLERGLFANPVTVHSVDHLGSFASVADPRGIAVHALVDPSGRTFSR